MSNPADKAKSATKSAPEGNVEQIRDILFGGQMRDYERRFEELDERLKRDSERVYQDQAKRFEQVDLLIKDHADKAAAQVKRLENELRALSESQAQALERVQRSLRQDVAGVDEKLEQTGSVLRERLHKLATETADAIRTQHNELSTVIEKMGTTLRDEKVAREELAGFFSEMALRLTRQFDLPKT